jgi:hypothetical protein
MSLKGDSPSSSDGDSTGLINFKEHVKNKPPNGKIYTRKSQHLDKEYIKQIEKEDAKNQSKKEREKQEKIKNLKAKIHSLNSNHSHSFSDIEEEIAKLSINRKPSPKKKDKKEKIIGSKQRTSKVHPAPPGYKTPPDVVSNWNQPPKYTKKKYRGGKRTKKKNRKSRKL